MTSYPKLEGPALEPASGGPARQLVVLLHGYGADGNDLIGLAPQFAQVLPDAAFVSPHAPFPCEMAPYGRQWFSLNDRAPARMMEGARMAAPILDRFLDLELAAVIRSLCAVPDMESRHWPPGRVVTVAGSIRDLQRKLACLRDQAGAFLRRGQIGRQGHGGDAVRGGFPGDRLQRSGPSASYGDGNAAPGKREGDAAADPRPAAGHQRRSSRGHQ